MKTTMVRPQAFFYGAAYGILLTMMYFSSYQWLIGHDWLREDYNYCLLVPLVVLYLIWEKRDKWLEEPSVTSWRGLCVFIPGILLFWIGELAGEFFTIYISSWLVVTGLLWIHAGWKKLRTMAFPLFVSLFLFPLPNFINTKLTFNLKLLSSVIGVKMLQFCGVSAYREGNVIDLGFTQLQVVDACSGLRYLIPLFIMGVLMAYFYRGALWKRIIVALSSIPLSIVTNSLRIAATAILYQFFGRAAAEGFFHDFEGFIIFIFSFLILLAEIFVLRKILPGPDESFMKKKVAAQNIPLPHPPPSRGGGEGEGKSLFGMRPQFIVAVAVLAITVTIHYASDFREKPPVARSFRDFPLVVGGWEGKRQLLDQQFIDTLQFTDYVSVNYLKHGTPPVNFYVAYYESQQKGRSIHSPETCLPGSGWFFKQAGTVTIPLSVGAASSITVTRALMEKNGYRQLVYFWFNERGRILTNAYEMKIYNLWDAVVKKRTDGALVRIISPVHSSENLADADYRLQSFVKEMMPLLKEFIPR